MTKYFHFALLWLLSVAISSCTQTETTAPKLTGELFFHIHGYIDNIEVPGLDTIVESSAGRKISLTFTQFYISNIRLVKADGSIYSVSDKVLLKTFWNELYLLGKVPVGTYKSVNFTVGFDSTSSAISQISSDTILNHPEMWFWNTPQPQGYIFLNFQGKIDTSSNANGNPYQMQQFVYKIGNFSNAKEISMPDEFFVVSANQTQYVHLTVNYMKLFEGLDLNNTDNLKVQSIDDNSKGVAAQVANNIQKMFTYEY